MKLVYSLGILAALSLASCSKSEESPTPTASAWASPSAGPTGTSATSRRKTARVAIPTTILPLLPTHGIYASGGGRTSTPWRVIIDLVAKTITSAVGSTVGVQPYEKLDRETSRPLTNAERDDLTGLAERAWREPMPVLLSPTGDYDEVLVSVDGEDLFFLEGFGPIRPAEAALLVGKMKKIALEPPSGASPSSSSSSPPQPSSRRPSGAPSSSR